MSGFLNKLIFFILLLSLSCCASKKKEEEKKASNAESDYITAYNFLTEKDYNQAAEAFAKIDDEYPFSKWAAKAQTMAAYAYYKEENYEKLLQIVDDFIRLNPSSQYLPYMLYMKGISYYNKIPAIEIAQDNSQQASFIFRELIARFPETDYANDVRDKLGYIDEHLAGARMATGRYEIKIGNYVGAIINFGEVIDRYRHTNQVPEAFFRIAEIYYKIGLKEESSKALSELNMRFPENSWTKLAAAKFTD